MAKGLVNIAINRTISNNWEQIKITSFEANINEYKTLIKGITISETNLQKEIKENTKLIKNLAA